MERHFVRRPPLEPLPTMEVLAIDYDGRFTLTYDLKNGDSSAIRVTPEFAIAVCEALVQDGRWMEIGA